MACILFDWIGWDWIGLAWLGLDWLAGIGLHWIGLDWIRLAEFGLDWLRLHLIGLYDAKVVFIRKQQMQFSPHVCFVIRVAVL